MALLFALVYDDLATAKQAGQMALDLEKSGYLTIQEKALVTKNADGDVKIDESKDGWLGGSAVGAVLGGLTGALFAIPVFGLAAGAAAGAWMVTRNRDKGSEEDMKAFERQISDALKPGGAAIMLLGQTTARERVVQSLGQFGGTFVSTDLTDKQVADMQREIDRISS